jgi:hypothetical protein
MATPRVKTTVLRIYDQVNLALWAALAALVIFFVIVAVPQIPRSRAQAEAARAAAREKEDTFYCRRWGLDEGRALYARCMRDLIVFRRNVEQQFDEDSLP